MANSIKTPKSRSGSAKRYVSIFLIFCFVLPLLCSCESRKSIVHGLNEKEANEIVVFLSTKGIEATKIQSAEGRGAGAQKQVLWDISVPTNVAPEAMSILNQSGLPRRRGTSLLGIFSDVGLVPSEMQERIRYQAGLGEQIAGVIRKIDGVLDAEVQISFPEDDPLNPGKTKGDITASVYVKHSGVLDDPNTHLVTKIKRLVMAGVTGLKYENVTVIPDRARFSEIPIGLQGIIKGEEKEFVRVWTLVLGQESVTRFRIMFFAFILILLFLFLTLVWIGWKVHPLLEKHGGLSSLFHLTPIVEKEVPEEEEAEAEEEKEEEEEETVEEEGSSEGVT